MSFSDFMQSCGAGQHSHVSCFKYSMNDFADFISRSLPRETITSTVAGPGSTITLPGGETTITVPGGVSTVTIPGGEITITAPGGETTITVPGGVSTVTAPGGETTVRISSAFYDQPSKANQNVRRQITLISTVVSPAQTVTVAGGVTTITAPGGETTVRIFSRPARH